ncbi:MAG: hypothetical protein WBR13_15090 [Allosphingosinicella sp.]
MRNFDTSSWAGILFTLVALALMTLIGVGVRVLMMMTIQRRRERMNRQINERLRTLISAYRILGGSFTGDLAVDPSHLRDLQSRSRAAADGGEEVPLDLSPEAVGGSDRKRRIRDSVEAALSDIILLGTEEHVILAERAANELVAGRPVHTHDLVVSLRNFIREALDLAPVPEGLSLPMQGPARPSGSGGRGRSEGGRGAGGAGGMGGGGGGVGGAMGISAMGSRGAGGENSASTG